VHHVGIACIDGGVHKRDIQVLQLVTLGLQGSDPPRPFRLAWHRTA
jgi:hypothetical protein